MNGVRVVWFRERSSTDPSHWTNPPTAIFSFAAHNRFATWSLICEPAWDSIEVNSIPSHIRPKPSCGVTNAKEP